MSLGRMALRDALVTAGFRGGWAAVRNLEEGPALRLVDRAAEFVPVSYTHLRAHET